MSNARNLARVIVDSSGDIAAGNLDNAVPADGSITAAKLAASLDLSSKTLTYPDNSVQSADIASLAASKLSGQVPDANAPSGSVIQVVGFSTTSTASISAPGNNSWSDVPSFSASITPRATNSKILVLIDAAFGQNENTQEHNIRLVRNGTVINIGSGGSVNATRVFGGAGYTSSVAFPTAIMAFDSPNTTSAVTYKLQWANQQGVMLFNYASNGFGRFESRIVLMEIAA